MVTPVNYSGFYRLRILASYLELVGSWALVILFVLLQLSSSVWLVSDFNWITFVDFDEAYQVEQFLNNMKEDSIEGLPDLKFAYGSELFVLIPFYKLTAAILGGASGLGAYRFLKVVHIIAAGLSLLLLRAVLRQIGAPRFVPLLVVVLVISSPLFYPYALHLKPDANIVLFLLMASYWALLKFHGSTKSGWLVSSIALAALAAAIKWWGVFLLIPQLYLVAVRDGFGPPFKPPIGCWRLLIANTISCTVLVLMLVVQAMPLVQKFPYSRAVIALAIGATALLVVVCFGLIALNSWLLLRQTVNGPTAASSVGLNLTRLSYCFLSIGCVFAASYVVFAAPFLLSDQLQPSISNVARSSVLMSVSADTASSVLRGVTDNVVGWVSGMMQSGVVPLLLIPALLGSVFVLLWGLAEQEPRRRLLALALFPATLLVFLVALVSKKNGANQAMVLPFVATLAVAPVAMWAVHLKAMRRNLVITALVLLVVSQTVFQLERTLDVISSYPKAIQAISTVNGALSASIKKVSETDRDLTLFIPGREFPIHSGVGGTRHFSGSEYVALVNRLLSSCDGRQSGRRVADRDSSAIFLVIQTDRGSTFAPYLQRVEKLRDIGCLDLITEIAGDMYSRGGRRPVSFAVYQIRARGIS